MVKDEIMNKLVIKLCADSWKEDIFMGFYHLYVIKNNAIIEDYRSIHEAKFDLEYQKQ